MTEVAGSAKDPREEKKGSFSRRSEWAKPIAISSNGKSAVFAKRWFEFFMSPNTRIKPTREAGSA